jgi:hypothetical protein
VNHYTERDNRYYRAGLVYELDDDGTWQYEPDGPFFVDGIRYSTPSDRVVRVQPMIELKPDGGTCDPSRMRHG